MSLPTREQYQAMEKQERNILFKKMTPQERSNIMGFGSEDEPAYCDANGHCYSFEDDAVCADSYIKEIKELKDRVKYLEENELTEESAIEYVYQNSSSYEDWVMGSDIYEKLKKENEELKDKLKYNEDEVCRYSNAIEEEYVLRTDYEELEEENKKLKEENEGLYDEQGAQDCLQELGYVTEEDHDELREGYKATKIELHKLTQEHEKLTESKKYWKNFALVYWSADQLGDDNLGVCGSEVWQECLDKIEDPKDNSCPLELTAKCMADDTEF